MSLSGCHWLCFFLLSLALVVRAEQTIGRSRAPPEKPCVPLASGSVVENVSVRSEGCRVTVTWESSQATPNASYHYQVQVSTPHWSTSTSTPSQQAHVTLPPPPPPSPAHQCVELVVGVRVVMVCGGGGAGGEEGNWTRVEGVKVCSCVGGDGGRGVRSVVFGGIMGAVAVGSLVFLSVCGLLYWRHQRHLNRDMAWTWDSEVERKRIQYHYEDEYSAHVLREGELEEATKRKLNPSTVAKGGRQVLDGSERYSAVIYGDLSSLTSQMTVENGGTLSRRASLQGAVNPPGGAGGGSRRSSLHCHSVGGTGASIVRVNSCSGLAQELLSVLRQSRLPEEEEAEQTQEA